MSIAPRADPVFDATRDAVSGITHTIPGLLSLDSPKTALIQLRMCDSYEILYKKLASKPGK
jgi:hypothetical protein